MRNQQTRFVSIRERIEIVEQIEALAENHGTDRSSWIRGAIREKLQREHFAAPPATQTPAN